MTRHISNCLVACVCMFTLAVAADEEVATRKKVVSVGKNNASIVAEKIKAKATTSPQARHRYLVALYQVGKPADAVRFFNSIDPSLVTRRERIIAIRCLLDLNQPRDAYIQLKAIEDPKKPDIALELLRGKILIRMKEWKAAKAVLTMVIRVSPNDPEAHYFYALTCLSEGDYATTISHCNRVWELSEPNSKLSRLSGALMLGAMAKLEKTSKKE